MAMKALFFLRHYNDIDHITPVIYKWIDSGHQCDVVLIGAKKFRHDFRMEFLSQHDGVRVAHIREIFTLFEYIRWRLQMYLLTGNVRRLFFGSLVSSLAEIFHAKKREPLWRYTADKLLTRSFAGVDGGVVTFDWIERNSVICVEWVEMVIAMARAMGLGVISLPHGDSPHANQLIRRGEWQVKPDAVFSTARIFDKLWCLMNYVPSVFALFLISRQLLCLARRVSAKNGCPNWLKYYHLHLWRVLIAN